MFTHLAGYAVIAQRDEPLALSLVEEQRKLTRPVFTRFRGREVKTLGDGALVEFDSALQAVQCAAEIQRRQHERNSRSNVAPVELRIGIHLGDVEQYRDDIFGDAVNIASRIEPLAEAGGVCVTGSIQEQVQNKIPYALKLLEHPVLKNIESPVSVYRVELPWTRAGASEPTPSTDRTSATPAEPEYVIGGPRRLAAIMVTDMVGFSALTQRDESLALRLVDEQRKLTRPVFDQFRGKEVKTMGDGALVEFDSALDATDCAVAVQRQLFERNRDAAGERIELRVGIHAGDVVHSESDVYGDAVNIASRIEPLAETGGVCVTGSIQEQVQNKIPYPLKLLERTPFKSTESPVTVYRVELPWTPPSLSEASPFTDRKVELDQLRRASAGLKAGEGRAIAISGEAGIGKTRLLEEFAARAAREGTRILRGRGDRGGLSIPFAPWSGALRDFAREAPNPLLDKVCAECAVAIAQLVPELKSRLGPVAESAPSDELTQPRLFEGVLRFLENTAREAPLIVAMDDFQWADSTSLQLLEYIARRLEGRRMLLVVAYRDEPPSEAGSLDTLVAGLVREHQFERVPLKRFDPATSVQMLVHMLRGRLPASGGELAPLLIEKSGGNPMILESMLQSVVREGSLVWTEEGWAPKTGVDLRLPPGVESVVRQRLVELEPLTVDILRQASVLGFQFSFDALQRTTGVAPEELLTRLEEAIRARILDEQSVGSGRSTYVFTDRPVRETLYNEISLARRPRYHSDAARVLESLAAEGVPVPAAELAYHFRRANESEKALEYTLRAADEAARLSAREEAFRQYGIARELLESRPDEKRRAEILFKAGEQLDVLGRHSEAYRSMCEAAEVYEHLGLTLEAGRVHQGIARRIYAHNELVRATEHIEKARRLLETGPPSLELALLYDDIATVLFQEVRMREAAENWRRAIDIATKVGALGVEASARRWLACVVPTEESGKVWEYLDTALDLATRADVRTLVPTVMMLQAIALLQMRGDGRGARRRAEDTIEYARRGQDMRLEMFVKGTVLTHIEWRLGDLERAERIALEHRAFAAGDPRRERPFAITVLAEVALARGEIDRAEKLLWEAERLLVEGGDWGESEQTQIALARCALRRKKPLSAVDHLRTACDLCHKAGPPAMDTIGLFEALSLIVRAFLDAGSLDEAETSLRELTALAEKFGEDLGHAFRARAEGWVRMARAGGSSAVAPLEESVRLWKRIGWQYEWAETLVWLASAYRSTGERARATALTDQADEFLSKVGARPALEEAESARSSAGF